MGLIQDNPKAVLGVAFIVAAGLAGGAGVIYVNAGDDTTSVATSPVVTPAPSQTVQVPTTAPTPDVTASASASATPTATATATASASATPSPTLSPGTKTYPYPRPTQGYEGLILRGTLNPGGGTTATVFHLTLRGTDGDGTIGFNGLTYGDGAGEAAAPHRVGCRNYPPLTSPPGAYQPEPDSQTYTFRHRYTAAGTYTLTMHLTSSNADCKPHGPKSEARDAQFTVVVAVAPPVTPTPSPTPKPTVSPSASPTPSPTATP